MMHIQQSLQDELWIPMVSVILGKGQTLLKFFLKWRNPSRLCLHFWKVQIKQFSPFPYFLMLDLLCQKSAFLFTWLFECPVPHKEILTAYPK